MTRPRGLIVRDARLGEAAAAAEVHTAAAVVAYAGIFPTDAPKPTAATLTPSWARFVSEPDADVLVAEADGEIVGAVAVVDDSTVPAGLLMSRLYVRPDRWRDGIGSRLHDAAITRARDRGATAIDLWVLEANEKARAMYERRGWRLVEGRLLANEPPHIVDVLYELQL